jgi:hypothetical protein
LGEEIPYEKENTKQGDFERRRKRKYKEKFRLKRWNVAGAEGKRSACGVNMYLQREEAKYHFLRDATGVIRFGLIYRPPDCRPTVFFFFLL